MITFDGIEDAISYLRLLLEMAETFKKAHE